jgi:hypothetical protein
MNAWRWTFTTLAAAAALSFAALASANVTVDRDYRLGDAAGEGAVNSANVGSGNAFGTTFDAAGLPGMSQLIDLNPVNSPVYRTITGRPDGIGGFGVEFNGALEEYLRAPNLGDPSVSVSSIGGGGTIDYSGIVNRGLQFWVKPSATTAQTLVMDTNRHGARINAAGKFSMRYNNADYDSTLSVVPNTWYHVMVVRPFGAANGSRMYVNGNAVAFGPGGYDDDFSELVVGSNTGGDAMTFTGGTFNLATDNDYIAHFLSPVAGDVTNNGVLDQADKTAFIAGWYDRRLIPTNTGFITTFTQLGDMTSRTAGDLNFDGITDIFDLVILQNALTGAGIPAITPAEIAAASVPEPSTAVLFCLVSTLLPATVRRFRR